MVVSIMGACGLRVLWVVTVFAAMPTMNVLMFSYPVSWTITFGVMLYFFIIIWKRRFVLDFTPEELKSR